MRGAWIDKSAVSLSGLCLVHCLAGSVLIALAASAGGLFNHQIHAAGLFVAMPLAVLGLWRGVRQHGRWFVVALGGMGLGFMASAIFESHGAASEIVLTLVGVSLLGLAHLLNLRWRG